MPSAEAEAQARALAARVGLGHRLRHYPQQLSGGEMQRAAIARALVHGPALLVADEPTGNLDSENGARVLALLGELNREIGVTILLATHAPDVAAAASRVIRMRDGRLRALRIRLPTADSRLPAPPMSPGCLASSSSAAWRRSARGRSRPWSASRSASPSSSPSGWPTPAPCAGFETALDTVAGRTSVEIVGAGSASTRPLLAELGWLREFGAMSPVIEGDVAIVTTTEALPGARSPYRHRARRAGAAHRSRDGARRRHPARPAVRDYELLERQATGPVADDRSSSWSC